MLSRLTVELLGMTGKLDETRRSKLTIRSAQIVEYDVAGEWCVNESLRRVYLLVFHGMHLMCHTFLHQPQLSVRLMYCLVISVRVCPQLPTCFKGIKRNI